MGCRRASMLLVVIAYFASVSAATLCYKGCHFRFCTWRGAFSFAKNNDVALTGGICDKRGSPVGYVFGTGEAFLVKKHTNNKNIISFVPISTWRPKGLHPPLPRTLFKSYHVYAPFWKTVWKPVYKWDYPDEDDDDDPSKKKKKKKVRMIEKWERRSIKSWRATGKSGVGHQAFNGNQLGYVRNRCYVLPITSYQRVNKQGKHVRNIHTSEGRDCVAFSVNRS